MLTWFAMFGIVVCLGASIAGVKVEAIYVTSFVTLLLAGAGTRVYSELKEPPKPPVPPANPPEIEAAEE